MKSLILLTLVLSGNAFAYSYNCTSIDDNEPYGIEKFTLTTGTKSVEIAFAGFKFPETYIASDYSPKIPGPRAMMVLNVKDAHHSQYGEGPVTPFYGDKELLGGGYELKIGKLGGFLKTTGAGYRWAKYICVRKD